MPGMHFLLALAASIFLLPATAIAQPIFRCGNTYSQEACKSGKVVEAPPPCIAAIQAAPLICAKTMEVGHSGAASNSALSNLQNPAKISLRYACQHGRVASPFKAKIKCRCCVNLLKMINTFKSATNIFSNNYS